MFAKSQWRESAKKIKEAEEAKQRSVKEIQSFCIHKWAHDQVVLGNMTANTKTCKGCGFVELGELKLGIIKVDNPAKLRRTKKK